MEVKKQNAKYTISRHKGLVVRYLGYPNFKTLEMNKAEDILLLNTNRLKQILNLNLKSIAEVLEQEL